MKSIVYFVFIILFLSVCGSCRSSRSVQDKVTEQHLEVRDSVRQEMVLLDLLMERLSWSADSIIMEVSMPADPSFRLPFREEEKTYAREDRRTDSVSVAAKGMDSVPPKELAPRNGDGTSFLFQNAATAASPLSIRFKAYRPMLDFQSGNVMAIRVVTDTVSRREEVDSTAESNRQARQARGCLGYWYGMAGLLVLFLLLCSPKGRAWMRSWWGNSKE